MRIIALADTHSGTYYAFESIISRLANNKLGAVVIAGDWCDFGKCEPDVPDMARRISAPLLFVDGNHETSGRVEELRAIGGRYLPRESVIIRGVGFFGLPFSWHEHEDNMIEATSESFRRELQGAERKVLVTHMPPWGYARPNTPRPGDDEEMTLRWIRGVMDRVRPDLTIIGHLHVEHEPHECIVGGHWVLNPGPSGWEGIV